MANEDLIKQWVIDNLSKFGISLKKGNLAKESAEAVFPLLMIGGRKEAGKKLYF